MVKAMMLSVPLDEKHGVKLMLAQIFRGPGRLGSPKMRRSQLPSRFSPWKEFKTIELCRDGEPVAGVYTGECLDDIENHGFHITDAHVRITDSVI
jgi:hypothetical protein